MTPFGEVCGVVESVRIQFIPTDQLDDFPDQLLELQYHHQDLQAKLKDFEDHPPETNAGRYPGSDFPPSLRSEALQFSFKQKGENTATIYLV